MFKSKKSRYFALAAVVLVAALLIITATVVSQEKDETPDKRMSTLYVDTDGTEKFSDPAATEIDAAYLASASYTLGDGWYHVVGTFSLGSNMLYITGDTHIVLANNITMTASGGVTVTSGNSLSVYAQSTGSDMGRLSRSGTTITLQDNASLTNTAYITGNTAVSAGADVHITNGVTGTLRGSSSTGISVSSGIIVNDGLIESRGSINPGIYSSGYSEITIGKTGTVETISWGIRLMGGGLIDNSGTIMSTGGVTGTGIEGAGYMTVINREGALIRGGNDVGLILGLGGVIENSGTITCIAGSGLYIRPGTNSGIPSDRPPLSVTVTNNEGGIIDDFYNYKDNLTVTLMSGSEITRTFRMGPGDSTITFAGDPGASLTYTKVESTSALGAGITGVSIAVGDLPSTIGVGDVLVLIDGGGAISGYPKNSTYSSGGYSFNLSVAGSQLIATVTATPGSSTYGITVTPSAHTFPNAAQGYSAQSPVTITIDNIGTGETGGLSVDISGADASAFTISTASVSSIAAGGSSPFTIVPKTGLSPGTYSATVTVGPASGNSNPITPETVDVSFTVTSSIVPPPVPQYTITATAGPGANISPAGTVMVSRGSNQRFNFSADAGYSISAVIVDGAHQTLRNIGDGFYIFPNVRANHTIDVRATAHPEEIITLTITVAEGKGRAEFKVNDGPFQPYDSEVPIPANSDLILRAYGDSGYKFKEWQMGTTVYSSSQISFDDVTESLHLDLYFEKSGLPIWWIAVGLLLLLGLLLWFFVFYRRYYDVHIQMFSAIEGKERAHRKSPYTFAMKNGYSGAVAYRVKEDGEWKQVFSDDEGAYVIPRGEITGELYLEDRP